MPSYEHPCLMTATLIESVVCLQRKQQGLYDVTEDHIAIRQRKLFRVHGSGV